MCGNTNGVVMFSPAAAQAELSTGSGDQASAASKREIEPGELGDIGALFDLDVEGETRK